MKMKIEVEKLSKYKYVHWNGIFILRLRFSFAARLALGAFKGDVWTILVGVQRWCVKSSSGQRHLKWFQNSRHLKINRSQPITECPLRNFHNHRDITSTIPQLARNYNRRSKGNFPVLVKCFPKIGTGHLSSDLRDSFVVLFYCFLCGRLLSSNSSLFFCGLH